MKKNQKSFYFKNFLLFAVFILTVIIFTPAAKAAADLDIPLMITDGAGGSKTLYFGLAGYGTDNLDPSLGEATYPPMPPKGIFDARFNLPNGEDDSLKDYRHMGGYNYDVKAVYKIQFQPGSGKIIKLKWNLPAGVIGRLQDPFTGLLINVVMSGASSYEIQNPEIYNRLVMTITYNFFNVPPVVPLLEPVATSTTPVPVVPPTPVTPPVTPPVVAPTPNQPVTTNHASFSFPLYVTDGSSRTQILKFGLDASASDGLDASLWEYTYPPMPPKGIFDARFNLPNGEDDSLVDYRRLETNTGNKIYTIQYQTSEEKNNIKLSWSLPANVTGKLQDSINGQAINASMVKTGSYTVLEPEKYNKLLMTIDYSLINSTTPVISHITTVTTTPAAPNQPPIVTPTEPAKPLEPTKSTEQDTKWAGPDEKYIIKPTEQTKPAEHPIVISSSQEIANTAVSANRLYDNKLSEVLTELKQLRDMVKEQATKIKYFEGLTGNVEKLSAKMETALNNFITYGVDANTQKLGAGERAAVVSSYKNAFDKLPETEAELADTIKIANGRWPSITSQDAENKAKEQFKKIYKKEADMNKSNDNAAVTVMAYGLRQKAENRNLNSETNGIKIFRDIYGHVPSSTADWNIMQAITYSGASR